MKNSETKEEYEIEYQNVDYYGEYKYSDLLSKLSNLATKNAIEIGLWNESFNGKYGWVLVKQTVKLKRPLLDIKTQKVQTREVVYSDIDLNKHMNNTRYLEWVMDLLPQEKKQDFFIDEMTMHYLKEIAPKSRVDLYYGQEDDCFKIEFKIDDQTHFVISGRFKEKKV